MQGDILRIVVPCQTLLLVAISEKFETGCICSADKYSRYHTQEGFWHWSDDP